MKTSSISTLTLLMGLVCGTNLMASSLDNIEQITRARALVDNTGMSGADAEAIVAEEQNSNVAQPGASINKNIDNHNNEEESNIKEDNPLHSLPNEKPLKNALVISDMPNEVLFHILQNLPASVLLTASGTDRRFYGAINDPFLVKHIWIKTNDPLLVKHMWIKTFGVLETSLFSTPTSEFGEPNPFNTIAAIKTNRAHYFTDDMDGSARATIISVLIPLLANDIKLRGEAITANKEHCFTHDMNNSDRAIIIADLASLSAEDIKLRGEAIAAIKEDYFTISNCGYDKARIIAALAKLTVEKIKVIAANRAKFFVDDMFGDDKAAIIKFLASFTVEQINSAVVNNTQAFIEDMYGYPIQW